MTKILATLDLNGPLTISAAIGTSGQVLTSPGSASTPSWSSVVNSLAGTTNQITASASTGSVTLSLPSAVTISGAMTAGSFVKSTNNASQFLKADGTTAGDRVTWYIPTTTQSITSGTETAINIWSEQYNTDGTNSFVGASSQNITVKKAGRYNISALVTWAANATGYRMLRLYVNSTLTYSTLTAPGASVAFQNNLAITEVPLAVNDTIELRVFQTSGGALAIGGSTYISRWSMTYMGAN